MQETPLYDIIQYEDARRLPLAPGDRVLAPWEPKGERYGPGTVLQVAESKAAHLGMVYWLTICSLVSLVLFFFFHSSFS